MHEYEIFIEDINHVEENNTAKTLIEAEAASPEAYVKENGRFSILKLQVREWRHVIVTGDNNGSLVRYTFTE